MAARRSLTFPSLTCRSFRSAHFGLSKNVPSFRTVSTRSTYHALNTGAKIPAVGFGTFQDPDAQEDAVALALKSGVRHIDTARVYDTEKQVGRGIRRSGVPREEIFLTTKLWSNSHHPDDVENALDASLQDLDTGYVDLFMIHYPCTFARGDEKDRFPRDAEGKMIMGKTTFVDTWKAMEDLVRSGKVKAIGVSNFNQKEIEALIENSSTVSLRHRIEISSAAKGSLRCRQSIRWKCILSKPGIQIASR